MSSSNSDLPSFRLPSVESVVTFEARGPFSTKSKALLDVLFALPHPFAQGFFSYDQTEVARIPEDIRGFRSYSVRGLLKGSPVGGEEFHRIRSEIIYGLDGEVEFEIEDAYSEKRIFRVDQRHGIYFPPFLLHTYQTNVSPSSLLVIANTLFDPTNKAVQDTYYVEAFRKLQENLLRK